MLDKIRIGVISATHGLKGEVKVYPTTDNVDVFKKVKKVSLVKAEKSTDTSIVTVRMGNKGQVLVLFECINSVDEAEKFKSFEIFVDRENMPSLKKNENYIGDIMGMQAYDDKENFIGIVNDYIETGANMVLSIKREEQKDLLVPYIKDCIKDVDLDSNKIIIHLLDGLLDL